MNRRNFLFQTGAGVLGIAAGAGYFFGKTTQREFLLYAKTVPQPNGNERKRFICFRDLGGPGNIEIEIPFSPHSFIQHPNETHRVLLIPKEKTSICEVDVISRTVTQTATAETGQFFYGHGAYSPDGSLIYLSETDGEIRGTIAIRNSKTLSKLGEFPSHGDAPHDIKFCDEGRTLVVANNGWSETAKNFGNFESSIAYVDVATGKLLEKYVFPNATRSAQHLCVDTESCVIGMDFQPSNKDPIVLEKFPLTGRYTRGGNYSDFAFTPELLRKIQGNTLSVALNTRFGIAGVTCPEGNFVAFWRFPNGEFIKEFPLKIPQGLVVNPSQSHFVVTALDGESLCLNAQTLVPDPAYLPTFTDGSQGAHCSILAISTPGLFDVFQKS